MFVPVLTCVFIYMCTIIPPYTYTHMHRRLYFHVYSKCARTYIYIQIGVSRIFRFQHHGLVILHNDIAHEISHESDLFNYCIIVCKEGTIRIRYYP